MLLEVAGKGASVMPAMRRRPQQHLRRRSSPGNHRRMTRPLAALAKEYERMSALLVELSHVSQRWAEQPDRPQQLQALIEDEARGIQEFLFDLAWRVAETQGRSLGDLVIKAW